MPAEIKARLELVTGGGGVPAAGVMPGKKSEETSIMKDVSMSLASIRLFLKRPSILFGGGGGLLRLLGSGGAIEGLASLLAPVVTAIMAQLGLKVAGAEASKWLKEQLGDLPEDHWFKRMLNFANENAEYPGGWFQRVLWPWLKEKLGGGGPGKDPTMPASPRTTDLIGVSVPVASQLIGYYGGTLAQSLDEEEMLRLIQAQKKELSDIQELAVNVLLHNADLTEEQQNQLLTLVEQGIEAANLYGSTKDTLEVNRLLTEEYNRQLQVLKSMARYRAGRTRGLDLETTFEGRTYTGYASSSVTDVKRLEQSSYAHIRALVEQGTFG